MKYLCWFLLSLTTVSVLAYPSPSTSRPIEVIIGERIETDSQQLQSFPQYQVFGLAFNTPVEFSLPTEVGLNAQELLYPATSQLGTETFRILLIRFSQESQDNIQQYVNLSEYVKGVFLGIPETVGKPKERKFITEMVTGETIITDFPKNRQLEIYFIRLLNSDQVALIFESSANFSNEETEKIINSVAESLTEVPFEFEP